MPTNTMPTNAETGRKNKEYCCVDWNTENWQGLPGGVRVSAYATEKEDGTPDISRISYYGVDALGRSVELSFEEAKSIDSEFTRGFRWRAMIKLQEAIWHENAKDSLWADNYTAAAEERALQSRIKLWERGNGQVPQ